MGPAFRTRTRLVLALQLALWSVAVQTPAAHAQLVPSVGAASAPAVDPMQRAQRQADNVMRWIKVHADKPRAAPAAVAAATTAPTPPSAPTPTATRSAAPKGVAPAPMAAEPQTTQLAAPPPAEVPVAAPVAAPAPVAASKATPPPPAPEEEEGAPLKAIAQPQPNIPRNVLNSLNAGKVMVRFTVEPNGKTSNAEVLSSSNRKLNTPTITAVNDWRFEPIKAARTAQVEFDFLPQ